MPLQDQSNELQIHGGTWIESAGGIGMRSKTSFFSDLCSHLKLRLKCFSFLSSPSYNKGDGRGKKNYQGGCVQTSQFHFLVGLETALCPLIDLEEKEVWKSLLKPL